MPPAAQAAGFNRDDVQRFHRSCRGRSSTIGDSASAQSGSNLSPPEFSPLQAAPRYSKFRGRKVLHLRSGLPVQPVFPVCIFSPR